MYLYTVKTRRHFNGHLSVNFDELPPSKGKDVLSPVNKEERGKTTGAQQNKQTASGRKALQLAPAVVQDPPGRLFFFFFFLPGHLPPPSSSSLGAALFVLRFCVSSRHFLPGVPQVTTF